MSTMICAFLRRLHLSLVGTSPNTAAQRHSSSFVRPRLRVAADIAFRRVLPTGARQAESHPSEHSLTPPFLLHNVASFRFPRQWLAFHLRRESWCWSVAPGRNNSIHPQVLHQLSIVIPAMRYGAIRDFQSCQGFVAVRTVDLFSLIFLTDGAQGLVQKCE